MCNSQFIQAMNPANIGKRPPGKKKSARASGPTISASTGPAPAPAQPRTPAPTGRKSGARR